MAYVVILIVITIAVVVISAPLRAQRSSREADEHAGRRAELVAARDAKYREIRDAEMDLATGKLSNEDYAAIDTDLRREAIEIMHALDGVDAPAGRHREEAASAASA